MTIKSTSNSQHEILSNISFLHNNGKAFECDITYSTGNFYGKHGDFYIGHPKFKFDICPMDETVEKIEPWGDIPLKDCSIKSVVFDPPFIISPRDCASNKENVKENNNNIIFRRFSGYYPINELLDSYHHWLKEIYRILEKDGIAVIKCQPTVSAGKEINSHMFIWLIAESLGFDLIDEFILISNGRLISGKIKKQQHARKYHSYFFVLKKSTKKKVSYLNFLNDTEIKSLMESFYLNNAGKNNGCKLSYREEYIPQLVTMNKNKEI